jgi:hypothetical protein
MYRSFVVAVALASALTVVPGTAQDLMPPHIADQLGLSQAWSRPVPVPVGAQSIADQQLFVHQQNPREYVEIVTVPAAAGGDAAAAAAPKSESKVLARIAISQGGSGDDAIDKKEALRLANNEIRRLKRRGIEATINTRMIPRVNLYTIATDGALECRNAETGAPIWMVHVGNRRLPYRAIGVSEHYLTVINGANLIQVDASNGEVMVEVPMSGTPRFGAINSGDYAVIPTIGGGIEGYPLKDATRDPFMELVAGSALKLPRRAPDSTKVAWGTDRGFVYVMETEGRPSVLFRLNTDGIVSGRLASATGERFFFGSEAGQVYGLRATRSGKVLWSQPFGEPFYNEPIVVGDQVLIRSGYGNLFSLNTDDGAMTWDGPMRNVAELIGSFGGRIFITTLSGAFAVIDLETGKRIGVYNEIRPGRLLVNHWTDRLYLISDRGDVQCLRPEGAEIPTFNIQPDIQPAEVAEATSAPAPAATPFDAGNSNPFGGGGADPFGGGGADPFGGGGAGGADPFGGGGDAPMDDPFGGNPFGN